MCPQPRKEERVYFLFGVLCGLALYHQNMVHLPFPLVLFKKLLRVKPVLEDLREFDPVRGEYVLEMHSRIKPVVFCFFLNCLKFHLILIHFHSSGLCVACWTTPPRKSKAWILLLQYSHLYLTVLFTHWGLLHSQTNLVVLLLVAGDLGGWNGWAGSKWKWQTCHSSKQVPNTHRSSCCQVFSHRRLFGWTQVNF